MVIDSLGCILYDEIQLNESPIVDLGIDQVNCIGDTVVLTTNLSFQSYLWSTGETSSSIVVSENQNLYVDVVDSNGCNSSDTISIVFIDCTTFISNTNANIKVFPNPFDNELNVILDEQYFMLQKIEVYSILGELQNIEYKNGWINTSNLSSGVYFLNIDLGEERVVKKVIKK